MNQKTPRRVSGDLKTFALFETAGTQSPSLAYIRTMLAGFLATLKQETASNPEEFCRIIGLASEFRLLGMSQKELASHFEVTPETLQRWTRQKNLPVQMVRKAYLAELGLLIQRQIDRLPPSTTSKLTSTPVGESGSNVVEIKSAARVVVTADSAKVEETV